MLLSSVSESTCFFLGALSDMPAVRAFALYAGMALLIDFLMQITVFVALLSLDMARQESRRYDVLCCVKASKKATGGGSGDMDSSAGGGDSSREGTLYRVFNYFYAPFLMRPTVRAAVVVIFFGWFCASLAVAPDVEVGLDQEISMPDDSYVLKYFEHMKSFLSVGPPFYVVLRGQVDYTDRDVQNRICGSSGCDADSLQAQIKLWSKQSNVTYVASPAQSWLDDYFEWLASPQCCSYNPATMEVCQSNAEREEMKKIVEEERTTTPRSSGDDPGGDDTFDDFFSFDDDGFGDWDGDDQGKKQVNEENEVEEKKKDEPLPDHYFKNYDAFYYYEDEGDEANNSEEVVRQKRAIGRFKRTASKATTTAGACVRCDTSSPFGGKKRPSPEHFRRHLKWFLEDNPGEVCPSAGKAAYR